MVTDERRGILATDHVARPSYSHVLALSALQQAGLQEGSQSGRGHCWQTGGQETAHCHTARMATWDPLLALSIASTIFIVLQAQAHADPSTAPIVQMENAFVKWVDEIGSSHSTFPAAKKVLDEKSVITVDRIGFRGNYTSVQAAVDSVPENNQQRVLIRILAGCYWQKVIIPNSKPFITLEGDPVPGATTIVWADTASSLGADGTPLMTFNSSTVAVNAAYFIVRNLTFKNAAIAPLPGAEGGQAVALRISGDAAAFYNCQFLGFQDTLYDDRGRHYFKDCFIEGSVDFIFGDGRSLYSGCHLHAVAILGVVTAQKRLDSTDDTGFSFVNCTVTGSSSVYLGRAWGSFFRVVYSYTFMDSIIFPPGWLDWNDPARHQTVFYGQYHCYGPGARQKGRVPWSRRLPGKEAQPFLTLQFIDGSQWLP